MGGQNVGAGRMDRVQEAFRKALALAIAIGVVGSILLVAFDYPIITFFMQAKDDPSVIDLALTYLFLYFPFHAAYGCVQCFPRTVPGYRTYKILHGHGGGQTVVCQTAHDSVL